MEITTLGGIIMGFVLIVMGIVAPGGDLLLYWDVASVFITLGGALSGTIVAFPLDTLKNIGKYFSISLKKMEINYEDTIHTLSSFAEMSRKEGILSLEDKLVEINDPFLKKGLQMAIDGTEEDTLRATLDKDMEKLEERHALGKDVFDVLGYLAPSFGMIGTLIGLIMMLANLEDKSAIGSGMATALITTLYGAIVANLICIPINKKLEIYHKREMLLREMMVEGILTILRGENTRTLKDKLISFLPTEMRSKFIAED
ncbi:MAG TPA: motility protein A [Spirochaetota bacterium]|nr:motility protein A [Spirochaetota bacterium]HOM37989.1 motility protein A [Spirochaetota bacterium]HPQ48793.1 motility protein A [Spirochaetota bacterium]